MKNYIKFIALPSLICVSAIIFTACKPSQPTPTEGELTETPSAQKAASTAALNFQNTIIVNSSETITVVPDIAKIIYAVQTEAKDAAECHKNNSADVNKVIGLLKSLGIMETSIQTSDYRMSPIYDYSGNTQRITGYQSSTTLAVADISINDLGNILQQSVDAGINNIQSITYQSSKYDEGYTEALKLAVAAAKVKAEALAEAGEFSIGSVVNICENSSYSEARYTDNALSSKMRSLKESNLIHDESINSVMPGEVAIEVNITVEYSILY